MSVVGFHCSGGQAGLPGVASMIKATQRCEDYLRYICEVDILSDDSQNFRLRGDVYQIEMAWKIISFYLHQQQQIHSRLMSSAELERGERHVMENIYVVCA